MTRRLLTDRFTMMAGNGDIYRVNEYTSSPGRAQYRTDRGFTVINYGEGNYAIPKLGVIAVDGRASHYGK